LTAFKVNGIPEIVIDLLTGMLNVDPTQRFSIQQVLQHPWLQSSSSTPSPTPSTTNETKSTSSIDNLNMDVQTTIPTVPKEIVINEDSKIDTCLSTQLNPDQVLSPPLDDSWSTHHRLIGQFEEKYGKLIAQQEKTLQNQTIQSSIDSIQYPDYSENLFQPTCTTTLDYDPSIYYTYRSYNPAIFTPSSDPSVPTTTRKSVKSTNQVGWKRKKK